METPGKHLDQLRRVAPLVQNITNFVAMQTMANVMLAAGASPAMVHAREEALDFAKLADALTINVGTLSQDWLACMADAVAAATHEDKPWVLDPVAVGATQFRRAAVVRLAALEPAVIRGNASEIITLSASIERRDAAAASGKGVDAADAVEAATDGAKRLARASGAIVAVTGEVDVVTDGRRVARIRNGHPLMPKVTALGCALTGIIGACLGAGTDPYAGTIAALAYYGVAGEHAGERAGGPGSFLVQFLDALYGLDGAALDRHARIEPED